MTADLGTASWQDAALAIRTTDTFAKGASRTTEIDGQNITVNGIAKGSGAIAPDMATMLAYIATDACIAPACLQQMLEAAVPTSFNAITVDSDTSTSDSLYLMATNKAGHETNRHQQFSRSGLCCQLHALMVDLAQQIVRDGEGAHKFITVK